MPSWSTVLSLALKYWKPLAVIIVAALIYAAGWIEGAGHGQAKWDAKKQAETLAAARQARNQAEATVKVVTEYVDKIKVVRERGATIIKEVPVYVTAQADADCLINAGFVRLHDAAAGNAVSLSPGAADAAPSGIALSAVAETVADNYQRCHENAAQLIALQQWTMAMGVAGP